MKRFCLVIEPVANQRTAEISLLVIQLFNK